VCSRADPPFNEGLQLFNEWVELGAAAADFSAQPTSATSADGSVNVFGRCVSLDGATVRV